MSEADDQPRQISPPQFHYREADVQVPELEGWDYIEDGRPLVWRVRQLSTAEIYRAALNPERSQRVSELISQLSYGAKLSGEELAEAVGLKDEETPDEVRRRLETLTLASVDPQIGENNRQAIVRLSVTHPKIFIRLTNKIDELTNLGACKGKPPPSGETPTSS